MRRCARDARCPDMSDEEEPPEYGVRQMNDNDLQLFNLIIARAPLQPNGREPHPDDDRCAEFCLRTLPLFYRPNLYMRSRRVPRVKVPRNMVRPADGAPPQRVPHLGPAICGARAILARLRASQSFAPFFLLYGGFEEPPDGGPKVFHWSTVCPFFGNLMILNALTASGSNELHYGHKIMDQFAFAHHFLQKDEDQSEFKNELPLLLVPLPPSL